MKNMIRGKRGFTWIEVLVIMGILLVLAFIILWAMGKLPESISRLFGSSTENVGDIARNCKISADSNDRNSFCCKEHDVIYENKAKPVKVRCFEDVRLYGDASVDCSDIICGIPLELFKQNCKKNCVDDNGKKEKAFCCEQKIVQIQRDVNAEIKDEKIICISEFGTNNRISGNDASELGFDANTGTLAYNSCVAVDCTASDKTTA